MIERRRERTDDPLGGAAGRRYRLLLGVAALCVFWERLWPRLWPTACLVGAFVGVALLDVLPRLPGWLHTLGLALSAAGLVAALAWAAPALRPVGRAAAQRRLERDSGVEGRPLQALEDQIAGGRDDLLAEAMWRRHRQRMSALMRTLRVRPPRTDLARHEPWGVRAGVLLLLAVGIAAGHGEFGGRLARALDPGMRIGGPAVAVEVWITPPTYTGAVPIYLRAEAPTAVPSAPVAENRAGIPRVPSGSAVLARVAGVTGAPTLVAGTETTEFAALGAADAGTAWRAETTVVEGDRILVRAGRRQLAAWPVQVEADAPPRVAFAEPPAATGNGLLGIAYKAEDDYGVAQLALEIEPAGAGGDEPVVVPLPSATPTGKSPAGRISLDLSAQRLAGQPVHLRLRATDAARQVGRSDPAEVVLPERTFTHPVAQRLVALRRTLFTASPEVRRAAADALTEIAVRPETFARDTIVSLALAVAPARLRLDFSEAAVASVRDLLWQTALRLEQGDVPLAERQLADARQRLADALRADAPQPEIERLMNALQQALDRYLAAAASELSRRGEELDAAPDPAADPLRSNDLREMLETARELARSGSRENAMRMLADLDRLLDGIRIGMQNDAARQQMAEAQAAMQALRDLAARQRHLLDETSRRAGEQPAEPGKTRRPGFASPQQGLPPQASPGATPADRAGAGEQQALRDTLGDVSSRLDDALGSIPKPLGGADQAMRSAVEALSKGRLGAAADEQARAAEALQLALQAGERAMAELMRGAFAFGQGEGGGSSGDIFGRSPAGRRGFATGSAKIPDRGTLQRAQEIRDELRRRASERSRPRDELEYIDRLLRQF